MGAYKYWTSIGFTLIFVMLFHNSNSIFVQIWLYLQMMDALEDDEGFEESNLSEKKQHCLRVTAW